MKIQNNIDFTIGIAPNATSIEKDMQFIKAALLYSDSITLISPVAFTYFRLTDEAYRKNERTHYALIEEVLPYCKSANLIACEEMEPILEQFRLLLHQYLRQK